MKPTLELISALRRAADNIDGGDYEWFDWKSCNCGVLYRAVFGERSLHRKACNGTWTTSAGVRYVGLNEYCEIACAPVLGIALGLLDIGLTRVDIAELEHCSSVAVLLRLGEHNFDENQHPRYTKPAFVSRYFRAQADLLEAQLTPPAQPQPVQHECCHMWLGMNCVYCGAAQPVVPVEASL